jgi:signal peptidase I
MSTPLTHPFAAAPAPAVTDRVIGIPREPWLAMTLSSLCCGLGQLYCGAGPRGLLLFCANLCAGPLLIGVLLISHATVALILALTILVVMLVVFFWGVTDAGRLAKQQRGTPYMLRDYNHLGVYVAMALSGLPYSVGLAMFVRANFFEAYVIPTSSMSPTLLAGDRILVTKFGLSEHPFSRGDLVVFRNPEQRRQRWIKRIVGLPGETLKIADGAVSINGTPARLQPLESPGRLMEFLSDDGVVWQEDFGDGRYPIYRQATADNSTATITLRAGEYYVLGDNRDHSADSRSIGPISHGEIIGVARYIYAPVASWARFGSIDNAEQWR